MKYKSYLTSAFLAGVLAGINSIGIVQDWMGKEAYLEHARTHWIDSSTTMPFHIAAVAACFILLFSFAFKERRQKLVARQANSALVRITPGGATAEDIAAFYEAVDGLYKALGGKGNLNFDIVDGDEHKKGGAA